MFERLAEIREGSGLLQTDFAEKMGVSVATQRSYERGQSSPTASYLIKMHEHGYDIIYLLTGKRNVEILSSEDSEMLRAWHNASPVIRNAAMNVLRTRSNTDDSKDNKRTENTAGSNQSNVFSFGGQGNRVAGRDINGDDLLVEKKEPSR